MTGKEAKERLQKQYKRQNQYIKEKYDRISATLPNGTIDRIKALGLSVNSVVNRSVLDFLTEEEKNAKPSEHVAKSPNDCPF